MRWLGSKEYKNQKAVISQRIEQSKTEVDKLEYSLTNLSEDLSSLLKIEEKLNEDYKNLKQGIQILLDLESFFKSELSKNRLPDYLFVDQIIKEDLLEKYFRRNKANLLKNLGDSLEEILLRESFNKENYEKFIWNKSHNSVAEIIDFKMVDYLLNKYDQLEIFEKVDSTEDIADLETTSIPFFNADNSYPVNNSHCLMLHHKAKEVDSISLKDNLKKVFSVVPQQIDTLNPNKFSLLKIDLIPDLSSLVKYNMGKKRVKTTETNL